MTESQDHHPRERPGSFTGPFRSLDDRLANTPVDQILHEGVPAWLESPLRGWLGEAFHNDDRVAERVALSLRSDITVHGPAYSLTRLCPADQLLTVVDATLQLHDGWRYPPSIPEWFPDEKTEEHFERLLERLTEFLLRGNSVWRVDRVARCLVRRVDETVQAAVDESVMRVNQTAADHLRVAWAAAYGMSPDPDKVFNEAIRAVEEIACPLVEQRKAERGGATLGTVMGELRGNSSHKWALVLPGRDAIDRDAAVVVAMMETLWEAQRSRHGGGSNSRRQTLDEAKAALHLAVLLVQWLSTGVMRRM